MGIETRGMRPGTRRGLHCLGNMAINIKKNKETRGNENEIYQLWTLQAYTMIKHMYMRFTNWLHTHKCKSTNFQKSFLFFMHS